MTTVSAPPQERAEPPAVLRRERNPEPPTLDGFFLPSRSRMPKRRMSLRMIKDVIRLKSHAQLSHAQIATTLKISKGVVAKYVGLATAAGLDWQTVQDGSEQQLSTALQPRSLASQPIVVPDWGRIHRELDRKGVTLMLLWQEYVAAHPEGRTWRYTQFCEVRNKMIPLVRQASGEEPGFEATEDHVRVVLPRSEFAAQ